MNNTNDFDNAIHKLTHPWTDVLGPKESGTGKYLPIDFAPLLDMLADAKTSSSGFRAQGGSAPAERAILNLEAFGLWEHIDGTTRAWLKELSTMRPEPELKAAIRQLAGLLKALHASAQIKQDRYENITAQFPRWVARIWEMFDPPVVKTLIGPCPHCAETHYVAPDGSKTTALIAYFWKGLTPEAKCQRCGERWTGERELLNLGYSIGANVDEEALREMGLA